VTSSECRHLSDGASVTPLSELVVSTDVAGHDLTWKRAAEIVSGWPALEIIGHLLRLDDSS
jgi:hypothetical protein